MDKKENIRKGEKLLEDPKVKDGASMIVELQSLAGIKTPMWEAAIGWYSMEQTDKDATKIAWSALCRHSDE